MGALRSLQRSAGRRGARALSVATCHARHQHEVPEYAVIDEKEQEIFSTKPSGYVQHITETIGK
jgi:hypothetical protein